MIPHINLCVGLTKIILTDIIYKMQWSKRRLEMDVWRLWELQSALLWFIDESGNPTPGNDEVVDIARVFSERIKNAANKDRDLPTGQLPISPREVE